MEPVNDFSPLTLIEQTLSAKKDKKRQSFYKRHEAKKAAKKIASQSKTFTRNQDMIENERRTGDDRRTKKQKQKRFDLRNKFDRRQSSALSLKI